MKYNNFKQLERDYSGLFEQGKYKDALNLLAEGAKTLPEYEYQKYLFTLTIDKIRLFIKCGMIDECISSLIYLIGEGFTCPLYWTIFEPLAQDIRFKRLSEKNELLRACEQEKSKFQYRVYLPENYSEDKKYPLFFNLHGDTDNIDAHKEYWRPDIFIRNEFIVVYVQASQFIKYNGYAWLKRVFHDEDIEACRDSGLTYKISETCCLIKKCYDSACSEIKSCYDLISRQYSIDEGSVIIGGFSGGATASIDITMAGVIPIKGFISLSSQKPSSFTKDRIRTINKTGIKGVFMEGEKDLPVQEVNEMIKIFEELDIPFQYYINSGIGHWYPDDLDDKLEQAIKFILNNQ